MYGNPNSFDRAGGSRGKPLAQPAQHLNTNLNHQNPNIFLQNPAFPPLQNLNLPLQNPNFPLLNPHLNLQHPNFSIQNPNFHIQNPNLAPQQLLNLGFQPQSLELKHQNFAVQNPNFQIQNTNLGPQKFLNSGFQSHGLELKYQGRSFPQNHKETPAQNVSQNPNQLLEKIEGAVGEARHDLLATGENVSAWKVSQAALLTLQVETWSSLGFQMQEVPALNRLIVTEGKVNAFIHCFVGVRRITSLYDLEVAICKNEGIEQFKELELGPLLRHPLVIHYFAANSDVNEVFKITSEEIISYLCNFVDTRRNNDVKVEDFLDFIAKKRSVKGREKLGVRIQSLGMHISLIREARRSEDTISRKSVEALKQRCDKKRKKRPLSSQKMQLDERFSTISQRVKSFSSVHEDFRNNHVRVVSSSSEDDDSDGCTDEDKKNNNDVSHVKSQLQSIKSSDRVSSCPYPSAIEEMTRLGMKDEVDDHSSQKNDLDECFSAISHIKSFSSVHKDFGNKHIRFVSSSSEDEDSDDCRNEDKKNDNDAHNHFMSRLQNSKTSDRVSSCPYPSAVEEMTRLGLKGGEMDVRPSPASGSSSYNEHHASVRKKRRFENHSCTISAPHKLLRRDKVELDTLQMGNGSETKECSNLNEADLLVSDKSIRMFITTWKEACREHTISEVLERMLQFYNTTARRRKRINSVFSSYPFVGLLNVAVTSIKTGMWDSIYDAFQAISQHELTSTFSYKNSEYERIDVELGEMDAPIISEHIVEGTHSVTLEDVIGKVASYFEHEHEIQGDGKSLSEKKSIFLRKLCNCEFWLAEQFSIKEFKCLGYGEFFMFLEKHVSLLPNQLQEFLTGTMSEKFPLEVCMLQHQLVVLVSQASNCLKGNEVITKQVISELLIRQFPLLSFKMTENGSLEDFLDIVVDQKNNIISKCVQFSAALLGSSYNGKSLVCNENDLLSTVSVSTDVGQKAIEHTSVTSKDAITVLVRAPMLSDLYSWSHWDNVFAPALGPLVEFLLCEVNTKELLCVVTKDGRVVRIDHSATPDSFLEAVLQGSSFRTAVKLLSLFTLVGGEKQVPLSLLKFHARHAFEVILKNSLENMEVNDNALMYGKSLCWPKMLNEVASDNLNSGLHKYSSKMDKAVPVASRFFLDCLGYLPSEFRGFAADILLSGLRFVIKDAHSAILHECNKIEQRLMVHEVGLSLGIVEWIDDYHAFCSGATTDLFMPLGVSCLKDVQSELSTSSCYNQDALDKFSRSEGEMIASLGVNGCGDEFSEVCCTADGAEVFGDGIGNGYRERLSEPSKHKDAAIVIESIRQDEFGLGPNLSNMESSMLKKQHARLGRALHCLSQELYSQDSHFILELVQNADDNIYPANVEPTLTFILQGSGIVVLNNEQGFSSQNIRALCDVGNSTKKGSSAGYIGQKGIGFKSVFRVTDAPEIHSNGFHIKFDISEGQIGFVLPTVIPPCDIDYLSRLAFSDTDQLDNKCWNTCIVLPFRSKLAEETAMNSIITMFSDLHPSLLLFLHRLQCIRFRDVINGSLIVMRKEIVGNGIIKVSRGKEKMTWFVASQKLRADAIRREVQTTEIAIALTLQESDKGDYNPHLEQQPVFAFLPLRTYGLKFILQGDFILPSSREEVDGDSPWNQWLLSEFPGLFVNAEKSFCGLPCFRENPGKAVATYMSFVPLVGEVHGFFSSLPRMIISKLRMSNCLFLEGDSKEWVPPCKVIRGWNDQARILLPDGLLRDHFGLGFLDKDIVLSDPLARALGIEEYGPKILLQVISSLCHTDNGLKSMGLGWLSSWLNALYTMSFHSSGKMSLNSGLEKDLIKHLQKIPFIPLSDGTYSSVDKGTIWMHSETLSTRLDGEQGLEAFPNLYAKLRTVNPTLFTSSAVDVSCLDVTLVNNLTGMLHRIGVRQLSAHEILKLHILPTMSADRIRDKNLMTEYICFVMIHLQSSCPNCRVEREFIISELQNKAFILTNYGFKRPVEVPIHFSKDFGNTVNVSRLVDAVDMKWHEVDIAYLKHPVTKSLPCGLVKWREFFQEIGVTDFVKVIQVDKSVADISHTMFKNMMWDRNLISLGSIAKDWESLELSQLLSLLSANGKHESCKYLLEVLDILWDECFSDKATGYCNSVVIGHNEPFKSSLISTIWDVPWVVSSMDDRLHYSKDLFYDCDAVRSVLGASAPYAVPKIRSGKLLSDIGFKTKVSLDDILGILKVWRRSGTPFKASIAQMSKLYTFIWNEMATSKQKIGQEFLSGPFIFVPYASESRHEDLVPGIFFSPQDVCWHDSTGSVDQMKDIHPQCSSTGQTYGPLSKTLCNVYPGLHDFFVNECGIHEIPPLCSYLHILLQLSTAALPSQAANSVFQIFLKWTDGLKSGLMSSEDIAYLKESLMKPEFTVLPTVQDKWVSLHPSFGLACWSDDDKLRKEFKHLDGIDYLYFGELSNNEKEMLQTKVSTLMQTIGIPALSKLVTREAIYDGPTDCRFKASLVNWALPYAQRYIYRVHPDKYIQLKQSGRDVLNGLQVVVVEKLFYRNIIKSCGSASTKRFDCSSLLQGNILYTTRESDSHALFMELSRLLFDGTPELHLSNFLHMITTMAESGSTEEQTEFFILNSQKVPKLPDEESVWSLSCVPSLAENVESLLVSSASTKINEQSCSKPKKNAGSNPNWPPVDWKTAPGFTYARENGFKTQAAVAQPSSSSQKKEDNSVGTVDWTIEGDSAATSAALVLPESKILNDQFGHAYSRADSSMDSVFDPVVYGSPELGVSNFSKRDQLNIGTPNAAQAILTGRLGELIAFKYFTEKVGNSVVKWVNEHNETGLPYDIVIGEENYREYIEVKATKSARKDWFMISMREWQFAVDKGDLFSVAHVVLLGNNTARVSIFKNPAKLCQLGKLQLVVMMPREQKEFSIVS